MVDETRVLRLLRDVTDRVATLEAEASGGLRQRARQRLAEVDDRRVEARLADLSDLRDDVASVVTWLERARP